MRVSRLFKMVEEPEPKRAALARTLLWSAFALVVLSGIVLYFAYERTMTPLL
jgi:hypothetical protein